MQTGSLDRIDLAIVGLYLLALLSIGAIFSRRNRSIEDFFFAGRGMGRLLLGVSIITSSVSAITYMGTPAFVFRRDLETLPMVLMSPLLILPLVIRYFAPFYYRLKLGTAYEYLERRFDVRVRTLASFLFLLLRGFYMGVVIYAPALVLSVVSGFPVSLSILIMGVLTTVYTASGGMRAVIWTDLIQFLLLILGITAITFAVHADIQGGWNQAWHLVQSAGKTKLFDFTPTLQRDFTVWSVFIGAGFFILGTAATDQVMIQRYVSANSEAECKKAVRLQAILTLPLTIALHALGLLLSAYYLQHPLKAMGMPSPDAVLPFFVRQQIGPGLRGLIIASIFAAAMGAMSGGINALTSASTIDFYKRLFRPQASDSQCLRMARLLTVFWGAVATVVALGVGRLGELANLFNKANSLVGGVILGIFLAGMLARHIDATDVLIGSAAGIAAVGTVATLSQTSWLFYGPVGCGITFAIAFLCGRLRKTTKEKNSNLLMLNQSEDQCVS